MNAKARQLVARSDAIAIVNRGGDYVTHVKRGADTRFTYTICGRALGGAINYIDGDYPTCALCRRLIDRTVTR